VKETSGVTEITTKATNKQVGVIRNVAQFLINVSSTQLSKRELTLVDKSGFSVRLTLWGKQAEQYSSDEEAPVVAFKGVRVGDFGGMAGFIPQSGRLLQSGQVVHCR
jgi:replication factor A1